MKVTGYAAPSAVWCYLDLRESKRELHHTGIVLTSVFLHHRFLNVLTGSALQEALKGFGTWILLKTKKINFRVAGDR